jgi:hypothetical protein
MPHHPKPAQPEGDKDVQQWNTLPRVPEPSADDAASSDDVRYLDREALRRRLIEAGG